MRYKRSVLLRDARQWRGVRPTESRFRAYSRSLTKNLRETSVNAALNDLMCDLSLLLFLFYNEQDASIFLRLLFDGLSRVKLRGGRRGGRYSTSSRKKKKSKSMSGYKKNLVETIKALFRLCCFGRINFLNSQTIFWLMCKKNSVLHFFVPINQNIMWPIKHLFAHIQTTIWSIQPNFSQCRNWKLRIAD